MSILVSPTYKSEDDITTALLLTHEMYHALIHSSGDDVFLPCFMDEARAFIMQYNLYFRLNQSERDTVESKLILNRSDKAVSFAETFDAILNTPGVDPSDQYLNYVRSDPGYQAQCANET